MSDRHRSRTAEDNAALQAAYVEKHQDIGADLDAALPKIDLKRRDGCRASLAKFAVTYCMDEGGFLETEPRGKMLDILEQMQMAVVGDGRVPTPFHIRMSRGHGKTSFVKCAIVYALSYGFRRYVVAVSADQKKANSLISDVLAFMLAAPAWVLDFPEVSVALKRLGGAFQRTKTQKCHGENTNIRLSANEIRLPTINPSGGLEFPACGAILNSVGVTGNARGLVHGKMRPDLVIFDDLQDNKRAKSPEMIREAVRKIDGEFMGLAGHRKQIAALMTSTPICPYDLSEAYAERDSWKTFTFPMILKWPDCWKPRTGDDLWEEYFDRKARDGVTGGDEAGRFYRNPRNRHRMDKGAEVLNRDNFDEEAGEASALQHAMNLYARVGAEAFAAEYQMEPVRPSSVYDLTPRIVRENLNGVPAFTVPREAPVVVATVDVMNAAGLRWAFVAFGPGNVAAVIAYGRHPANGRPIFDAKTTTEAEQDSAIDRALQSLVGEFASARLVGVDGSRGKVSAVGIDAGWHRRTVVTFCDRNKRLFDRITPMVGVSSEKFSPVSGSGRMRPGVLAAEDWAYFGNSPSGAYLAFHSQYWQEASQRVWFNEPLQPESLSLFGNDPAVHAQFADEVTADHLYDKDMTRKGRETWDFRLAPGKANHLGDCVKMAYALAYWHRLFVRFGDRQLPSAPVRRQSAAKVQFGKAPGKVRFA